MQDVFDLECIKLCSMKASLKFSMSKLTLLTSFDSQSKKASKLCRINFLNWWLKTSTSWILFRIRSWRRNWETRGRVRLLKPRNPTLSAGKEASASLTSRAKRPGSWPTITISITPQMGPVIDNIHSNFLGKKHTAGIGHAKCYGNLQHMSPHNPLWPFRLPISAEVLWHGVWQAKSLLETKWDLHRGCNQESLNFNSSIQTPTVIFLGFASRSNKTQQTNPTPGVVPNSPSVKLPNGSWWPMRRAAASIDQPIDNIDHHNCRIRLDVP